MAEERSKRPSNSAFKQQRLKAWQPLLTPKTVLPTFFIIGIIFIPLGVGLYITSQGVQEILIDYTSCNGTATPEFTDAPGGFKWKMINSTSGLVCTIQFSVPEDFQPPVYFYYRLTNFYQNHRRYVKSFSADQLRGTALPAPQLSECYPLDSPQSLTNATTPPTIGFYPCGLIANSVFNDTFSGLLAQDATFYNFSSSGIAWPGDKNRFAKTKYGANVTGLLIENIVPPPNWSKRFGYTWTTDNIIDISTDEHLQVWMRTAGLPTFRKLYGKSQNVLPKGTYTLEIAYNYPVAEFSGTKSFVISTSSWMGGKNPFLGIAYLVVGSVCVALGIAFLIRHLVAPRKLGDHTYIKWKQSH